MADQEKLADDPVLGLLDFSPAALLVGSVYQLSAIAAVASHNYSPVEEMGVKIAIPVKKNRREQVTTKSRLLKSNTTRNRTKRGQRSELSKK